MKVTKKKIYQECNMTSVVKRLQYEDYGKRVSSH